MTPPCVDKGAVARNFSRAAASYDGRARAQAAVAASLAARLPGGFAPALAVDLGCGTGFLSAELRRRFPAARIVGVDLAGGMTEACRRRFAGDPLSRFLTADAERDPVPVPGADLAAGACVAQWFTDPAATLARWGRSLAPGGVLAFALLLAGSFPELSRAYREAAGREFPGLPLFSPSFGPDAARRAGLVVASCEEEDVTALYESPREALRSFREIGASFDGHGGHTPLRPAEARRLLERYGGGSGRGEVTHRVQYLVAGRPA